MGADDDIGFAFEEEKGSGGKEEKGSVPFFS